MSLLYFIRICNPGVFLASITLHISKWLIRYSHISFSNVFPKFFIIINVCFSGQFIEELVNNLCTNKGDVLDMFVSKLYDKNGKRLVF